MREAGMKKDEKNICKLLKAGIICVTLFACTFADTKSFGADFTPTLDSLAGQPVVGTDPVEYYPNDLKSGYVVTKIENADPNNLPQNAITLYEKEQQTGEYMPVYYAITLATTDYGDKSNYDSIKYFKFSTDASGNNILVEGTEADHSIKYYVNSSLNSGRINTDLAGADVNKNFVGLSSNNEGGAISNWSGTIGNITGDFIGNTSNVRGGAIYNYGNAEIGDITGDFVGNMSEFRGGAIYNYSNAEIGDITGDFIGNTAGSNGGAIYNAAKIGDITGDFIGNTTDSGGGAIYNFFNAEIGDITGDFIDNSAADMGGGAIYINDAKIGNIIGDFIGNTSGWGDGGAIFNVRGTIGDIKGDFIGNTSDWGDGGAIYNGQDSRIGNITGDFIDNIAEDGFGGAIYNSGIIGDIKGDFIGNTSNWRGGGAIYNKGGTIGNITGNFDGNKDVFLNGNAQGGAIYLSTGTIGEKDDQGNVIGGIINSSFTNNYAKSETNIAQGGAIYLEKSSLNIIAKDNYTSVFDGNYTESAGVKDDNAITLSGSTLNFKMENGGKFLINDNITAINTDLNDFLATRGFKSTPTETFLAMTGFEGLTLEEVIQLEGFASVDEFLATTGYSTFDELLKAEMGLYGDTPMEQFIHMEGFATTEEFLAANGYNTINEYFIAQFGVGLSTVNIQGDDINNTVFYLYNDINKSNVNIGNTTLNTMNNDAHTYNFASFTLTADTNMVVDVDLANEKMDRIKADSYGIHAGNLNVTHLNLLSYTEKENTSILFADEGLAANVNYTGATPVAYSPIYKYDVMYSQNPEDNLGYFHFTRSGVATKNKSDSFNPAVLPTSVSTSAGAYTTQLQTFTYAFQNSENFMSIPYLERISIRNQNKYALSNTGDSTDVGRFSPLFQKDHEHNGYWVKPYVSFESIPLKNGPKVSNINYGTMIGYDTDMVSLKHGWDRVLTGYVGYNGASQRYSGIDTYQNGGLIGGTSTFYKGNFFNATTLSVGASAGHTTTMYGNEDYAMLISGIANKAGYNFEFQGGRYIIQPSMLMSYTFVNTFDYTNAAGVKIDSDPLHAIQLAPGVRFIMNTENGWQPYAAVNMVWNVLDKQKVMANDVRLPEMSIKPYVEYGLGIQKCLKEDKFTAFGQAMIHNGGRNGIALSLGLRWKVGRTEK